MRPDIRTFLALLLLLLAPLTAASEASRIALVIGNARYKDSPLINPVNDARALSAALRSAGFEVIELHEQGSAGMRRAIREFGEKLRGKDAGLFYFAGHGVQVRGRNYLVPVDADIKYEDEIEDQSVEIGLVLSKMESAKARVNLVILDACRNNPYARTNRSAANGLAPIDAPIGTLVAFATSPGQVASDGTGANGLYTSHLVREMAAPGLKVEDVFKRVRAGVRMASAGRQIPWENTSLEGDFYFREGLRRDGQGSEDAIKQAVADALTRSREEADREKQRLERFYTEKLEAERAAFRKEAADRIAELEKAALLAARTGEPAAPPTVTASVSTSGPAASSSPQRTNEEMPESLLLALGVDPAARNRVRSLDETVAKALRPATRVPGDTWTWYRTIRDGEGTERRNYLTATVMHADKDGYRMSQSDASVVAAFDAAGNPFTSVQGDNLVVHDPLDELYRFPLQAGATWSTASRERRGTNVVDVDGRVTVVGWEDVTTPAGRFAAVKVSKVTNRRSEPFPGQSMNSKRVVSVWYVPAVGNVARFEGLEVTDRGAVIFDQQWELDSFELR
jgi:uncharacterized caspase-like protein